MKSNLCSGMVVVVISGFFHLGAILKEEDHIVRTQTDPISYEKKMEELKDGEKGPSMPKIEYYKKTDFLTMAPNKARGTETFPEAGAADSGKLQPYELPEGVPAEVNAEGTKKGETGDDEYWWIEEGEDAFGPAENIPPSKEQEISPNSKVENSLKESAKGDDWLD